MNGQSRLSGPRAATVVGLVAGAVGIAVLWASGVEFPIYPPPGIPILLAGAIFVGLARWPWAPGVGAFLGIVRHRWVRGQPGGRRTWSAGTERSWPSAPGSR